MQKIAHDQTLSPLKSRLFQKASRRPKTKIPRRLQRTCGVELKATGWSPKAGFTTHSQVRVGLNRGKLSSNCERRSQREQKKIGRLPTVNRNPLGPCFRMV